MNTKMNNAKKFIAKGNKVKVTLRFRGREMAHVQQSKHILDDFAKQLEDVASVRETGKTGRPEHEHGFNCKTLKIFYGYMFVRHKQIKGGNYHAEKSKQIERQQSASKYRYRKAEKK